MFENSLTLVSGFQSNSFKSSVKSSVMETDSYADFLFWVLFEATTYLRLSGGNPTKGPLGILLLIS